MKQKGLATTTFLQLLLEIRRLQTGQNEGLIRTFAVRISLFVILHQFQIAADDFTFYLHVLFADMGVDIHGCGEIRMTHYLLNQLDVVGALTKPGAECMLQIVYSEVVEQLRLSVL